jgi:hypothetical protein
MHIHSEECTNLFCLDLLGHFLLAMICLLLGLNTHSLGLLGSTRNTRGGGKLSSRTSGFFLLR